MLWEGSFVYAGETKTRSFKKYEAKKQKCNNGGRNDVKCMKELRTNKAGHCYWEGRRERRWI